MGFKSILFNQQTFIEDKVEEPLYFTDLNLDQIISAITTPKKNYNLKPFFYKPLEYLDLIQYRSDVFKELNEKKALLDAIESFSKKMSVVKQSLKFIEKLTFTYNKKGWYLDTVISYCEAISTLTTELGKVSLDSLGFSLLHEYLTRYVHQSKFTLLYSEARRVKKVLTSVKYCVTLQSHLFSVSKYGEEVDYNIQILKTFEKFKEKKDKDYSVRLMPRKGMNQIEAKIASFVVQLFPTPFKELTMFCDQFPIFMDEKILTFDREIQVYIAYLIFIKKIKNKTTSKHLDFCFPKPVRTKRDIFAYNCFDLALANSFLQTGDVLVCNDFYLREQERILVVTGPNQGGKTTFARMFGQIHYLTKLGLPIPGSEAQLFVGDKIFTHFEKEEQLSTLRGKLQDGLVRIHSILTQMTSNSIVIINEIFNSTTLADALFLNKEILKKISDFDAFCLLVTFIDELTTFGSKTVSMVSEVVPEDPAQRTFKIIRKPADGLAYAISIARKHNLTYEQIVSRLKGPEQLVQQE